jgi:hypothetical protein
VRVCYSEGVLWGCATLRVCCGGVLQRGCAVGVCYSAAGHMTHSEAQGGRHQAQGCQPVVGCAVKEHLLGHPAGSHCSRGRARMCVITVYLMEGRMHGWVLWHLWLVEPVSHEM